VVYDEFGAPPSVREVADPRVPPAGVVVRVEATGLCRSDWHGWRGHDPGIALPHVPGHELAGVIEAAGAGVRRWRVGDQVTVPFVCACGRCAQCAAGDQQICADQTQPGFTGWGSFAELVALEDADVNLVRVPQGMGAETAATLGCRFATAFRAVTAQGRVRPGEWVAVHGCGGVGLSAVMVAVAAGAQVVAVDVSAQALELAARFGAAIAIDASAAGDVPAAIREVTGGGAHLSLDALGSAGTCAASVRCLRPAGRHVQVGLLPAGAAHAVPVDVVVARELHVIGSHGMAAHDYPAMLALVASGRLRPDLLVTDRIGLDEAPAALAGMGERSPVGITVIRP
jgi:alcohol dehydrogenase